jgi:hypothetical protein
MCDISGHHATEDRRCSSPVRQQRYSWWPNHGLRFLTAGHILLHTFSGMVLGPTELPIQWVRRLFRRSSSAGARNWELPVGLYGPEVKNAQGSSETQLNNPACEFDDMNREVTTQQCRSSVRKQTAVILILLTGFASNCRMSVLYLYLRCLRNLWNLEVLISYRAGMCPGHLIYKPSIFYRTSPPPSAHFFMECYSIK